jgi:hypothetical protein
MSKPFTIIAAIIFLLVAAAHAYRAYAGLAVVVGGHEIPVMASWIAAGVSAVIGLMLFREGGR